MNIKIINLLLITIQLSFSLTNDKPDQEPLLKCGKHFENFNIIFPNGIDTSTCFKWRGTLIHPQWCIAAAHAQPELKTAIKINNQEFYVEKVITHPYYHDKDLNKMYDICLIKLNKPIDNHPIVKRERSSVHESSRYWIVSPKNLNTMAGLVKLSNINQNVFGNFFLKKNFSYTFYNTLENLNNGNYIQFKKTDPNISDQVHKKMTDNTNRAIQAAGIVPKIEESDLAVWIEHGDSGSPIFSCHTNDNNVNLPPLESLKLIGIVVGAKFPPDHLIGKGHLGIILRLSEGGLNEFIDDIIDNDANGIDINIYLDELKCTDTMHAMKKSLSLE